MIQFIRVFFSLFLILFFDNLNLRIDRVLPLLFLAISPLLFLAVNSFGFLTHHVRGNGLQLEILGWFTYTPPFADNNSNGDKRDESEDVGCNEYRQGDQNIFSRKRKSYIPPGIKITAWFRICILNYYKVSKYTRHNNCGMKNNIWTRFFIFNLKKI